jgi:hypothetical protein
VRTLVPQYTSEVEVNPDPVTVRLNAGVPASINAGEIELMVGAVSVGRLMV